MSRAWKVLIFDEHAVDRMLPENRIAVCLSPLQACLYVVMDVLAVKYQQSLTYSIDISS